MGFQSTSSAADFLDQTLLPDDWNQKLGTLVQAAKQATPGSVDGACNAFAGKALEQLYGFTDFKSNGGYKLANDIAHFVAADTNWKFLGVAADQTVLQASQQAFPKLYSRVFRFGRSGYAAPLLDPIPRDLETDYEITLGRDRYVLKPQDANCCSRLELYRDGALRHG